MSDVFNSPRSICSLCFCLSLSFLCLTRQTGMFYTSYVSTSYNWQFYYLEYRLRGIDSLLHIISLIPSLIHSHTLLLDFGLHLFGSLCKIVNKFCWIVGENGQLIGTIFVSKWKKSGCTCALKWNTNHCQNIILSYLTCSLIYFKLITALLYIF